MRLFYSEEIELADGQEITIPLNNAEVGDISPAELWVNADTGYGVSIVLRTNSGEEVELEKGIDINNYGVESTGGSTRMIYLISDASKVKLTATEGDVNLDIKIIY